jgi:ribose-phosphate pyrophosphokinase
MIVAGSTAQSFATHLADALDEPLASVRYHRFPDGELLAAAPGFDGDRAVVVCSTTSPAAHLECLQLQDAVREAGATEVVTVLPYMGYARQERPAAPETGTDPTGYPASARAVARALSPGTDRVLTVQPHERAVCEFFDPPATAVDAAARLAEPLGDLADPLFLAPDDGARALARAVRDGYGSGDVDAFEKTRRSGSEVEMRPAEVPVEGRPVVVVDDIVATGSTTAAAVEALRVQGATRVVVACVHPLLAGDARVKLARAGADRVVGTDTIERPVSRVSAAPAVAERL